MKNIKLFLVFAILVGLLITSCSLDAPTEKQTVLKLGTADFSRFVAIGNSITAGYQSGSLVETHQKFSFPNQIAKQGGVTFEQPTISYPGIPPILKLVLLDPLTIQEESGIGQPTNLTYANPYNNLGIPGALLNDVLFATDSLTNTAVVVGGASPQPQFDLVLRGIGTQFQQAKLLQPTTLTFWMGNNDVLGFATSGGYQPNAPTPIANFQAIYSNTADSIATLGADVYVANIPDVTSIPFFTTVGPQMHEGIAGAMAQDTNIVGLFYQKHGEFDPGQTGAGSGITTLDYENNSDVPLITLLGSSYAALLGQATGLWYRDLAEELGVPVSYILSSYAGIDTTQPFGFHPQNPWPDALILDIDEQTTASTHVTAYNDHIQTICSAKGFHLIDINTFFNEIAANGYSIGGQDFSANYISGGLFSLDGVHPSDIGHGIVANEFIKEINRTKNASIPMVNVLTLSKPIVNLSKVSFKDPNDLKKVIKMIGGFQN